MTSTCVLFEMQGQQVPIAKEAKSRGLRTGTLNEELAQGELLSGESLVSGGKIQHVGLTGRNNQIDSVAWFAVTGASAVEAHQKTLSARAETIFNGAPVGDDPPPICPRHLTAEPAAS